MRQAMDYDTSAVNGLLNSRLASRYPTASSGDIGSSWEMERNPEAKQAAAT
jgi:hypothetical protein